MNPYWLGVGALGMYGYVTGRFSNLVDNFKKKQGNDFSETSRSAQSQPQTLNERAPMIIVQPNNNGRMSYFVPFGCACFIGLGGYYYYIHSNGNKKVIHKVKETAQETQDLVQKTDENNSKRFEILDQKNEGRAQNLELEIRSEQRAGFNVISEQIYCLTQVAIQTLSAIASNHSTNETTNDSITNEKLLGYCDKAQEMADTILLDEHMLKAKENNLKDIKAEIELRNNEEQIVMMKSSDITPGGPNYDYNRNEFDLNQNQELHIINHIDDEQLNNDNGNHNQLQLMSYYIYHNKQYIMLSSGILLALYVGNKTIDYLNADHNPKQY